VAVDGRRKVVLRRRAVVLWRHGDPEEWASKVHEVAERRVDRACARRGHAGRDPASFRVAPNLLRGGEKTEEVMSTTMWILLIVVLFVMFGGGGGYYWSRGRR
jgi:hypothetical protein